MSVFNSKKTSDIDKLLNENDELKNQLHAVLLKHGSYEDLDKNLIAVKKALSDNTVKAETLKKEISQFDADKGEKEKYLAGLNTKILDLEEIKENLDRTIKSYDVQVSILEDRKKELDERLEQANEIDSHLTQLKEKRERLSKDIEEKEHTFAYLSTIEREINADLEKEKKELERIKNRVLLTVADMELLDSTYKEKQNEIDSFAEREQILREKIESYNETETIKLNLIKSLEEKITLSEEIKNNIDSNLNILIQQLNENEKNYREHSVKRENIQEEILSLQKLRDETDYKYNFAREQFESLQAEIFNQSSRLNSLNNEIKEIETLRNKLQDEILSLRETEEKFAAEVSQRKSAIAELDKKRFEIGDDHLQTERNFAAIIEKFTNEFSEAKNKFNEIRQAILEKEKEIINKERTLLEKNIQVIEQEGALRLLDRERTILTKNVADYRNEKNILSENLASLKESIVRQKTLLASLHKETELLKSTKTELQRQLSGLISETGKEYAESESSLNALNEDLVRELKNFDDHSEKIASAKEELNMLLVEVDGLEMKKEEFTSKISELVSFEKNLKSKISVFEKEISALEEKKKDLPVD